MKLLEQYFELQKQIYDYFGYVEDWVVIPLRDYTNGFWWLSETEVYFSETPLSSEKIESGEECYSATIYTQRFLPKWVYRADDYTMIVVDTRTDGNKFLAVFDNVKEQNSIEFKKARDKFNDPEKTI